MKTCVTCKHSQKLIPQLSSSIHICNAPQNEVCIDEVTGVQLYRAHDCREQREFRIFGRSKYCGPNANWWEQS